MNAFVHTISPPGLTTRAATQTDVRRPAFASSFVKRAHYVSAPTAAPSRAATRTTPRMQDMGMDDGPVGAEEDRKLFVGNLSWDTTRDGLFEAFTKFGNVVSAKVIVDRESGRSRGFGFVEFEDPAAASDAMEQMNGGQIDGRPVRVDKVIKKEQSRGPY